MSRLHSGPHAFSYLAIVQFVETCSIARPQTGFRAEPLDTLFHLATNELVVDTLVTPRLSLSLSLSPHRRSSPPDHPPSFEHANIDVFLDVHEFQTPVETIEVALVAVGLLDFLLAQETAVAKEVVLSTHRVFFFAQ